MKKTSETLLSIEVDISEVPSPGIKPGGYYGGKNSPEELKRHCEILVTLESCFLVYPDPSASKE